VLREEAEPGTERGTLRLVSKLAVRCLPGDERTRCLGEAEHTTAEVIPVRAEILTLDRRERGLLGLVVRTQATLLVAVPSPRSALDAGPVEDAKIRGETLELVRTWVLRRISMLRRGPSGVRRFG